MRKRREGEEREKRSAILVGGKLAKAFSLGVLLTYGCRTAAAMLRVVKPKTKRAKRALDAKAPKLVSSTPSPRYSAVHCKTGDPKG